MEDFEAMVVMETYCWQPLHDRLEEGTDMEHLG